MFEDRIHNASKVKPGRLLFYDDVPTYGGHEVMTLNALDYLLSTNEYQIGFIYSPTNFSLEEALKKLQVRYPNLSLMPSSYSTGKLQFLRTLWSIGPQRRTRELIKSFHPDCILVVQGEIGSSSLGVVAAVRASIQTVSYIPLAQTRRQRGERPLPWLKDAILWWYYRQPHRYITISKSMSSMLRARGATQPIDVVENSVDLSSLRILHKAQARAQLGLQPAGFVAAICARIEFKQKGQDVLLRTLYARAEEFGDWTFLIVGEGPDKEKLSGMIAAARLGDKVRLVAWQHDMSAVYSAIDMMLLPSRFEGVPVSMLEAMYYGLPIVSSAVDAMAEMLPEEWTFPAGDSQALAHTMLRVRSMDNTRWLALNKQLVGIRFTPERQKQDFARVLNQSVLDSRGNRP